MTLFYKNIARPSRRESDIDYSPSLIFFFFVTFSDTSEWVIPSRHVTLTVIINSDKLIGKPKTIQAYHNIWFLGGSQYTPIPPSATIGLIRSKPYVYRLYDFPDWVSCLFIIVHFHWTNNIKTFLYNRFLLSWFIWLHTVSWSVQEILCLSSDMVGLFELIVNIPQSCWEPFCTRYFYWSPQVECLIFLYQFKNFCFLQEILLVLYIQLPYSLWVITLDRSNPYFNPPQKFSLGCWFELIFVFLIYFWSTTEFHNLDIFSNYLPSQTN